MNKIIRILKSRGFYGIHEDTILVGTLNVKKGGRKYNVSPLGTHKWIQDQWSDHPRLDIFNPIKGGWRSLK